MATNFTLVLLLALAATFALGQTDTDADPPARLNIPKEQLIEMKDLAITLMNENLEKVSIPDQVIKKKILGINYTFNISDIKVKTFEANPDETTITLASPNIVTVSTTLDHFELDFNLDYHFITRHNGAGYIKASDAKLTLTSTWSTTTDRKIHIDFEDASLKLGSIDVKLGTDLWSKIVDGVLDVIKTLFKGTIEKFVAKEIDNEVDGFLDKALASLNMQLKLGKSGYALDLAPIGQPVVNSDFIQIGINGDLYNGTQGPQIIHPAHEIPAYTPSSSHISIFLTSTLANLDYNKLVTAFDLEITVTQKILPDMVKIRLDTQDMNVMFPGMLEYYGGNRQCAFHIKAGSKGGITMNKTNNALVFNPEIDISIGCPNESGETDVPDYVSFGILAEAELKTVPSGKALYVYDTGIFCKSLEISDKMKPRIDEREVSRTMQWLFMFLGNTANGHVFIDAPIAFPPIDGFEVMNTNLLVDDSYSVLEFDLMPEKEVVITHFRERLQQWIFERFSEN